MMTKHWLYRLPDCSLQRSVVVATDSHDQKQNRGSESVYEKHVIVANADRAFDNLETWSRESLNSRGLVLDCAGNAQPDVTANRKRLSARKMLISYAYGTALNCVHLFISFFF